MIISVAQRETGIYCLLGSGRFRVLGFRGEGDRERRSVFQAGKAVLALLVLLSTFGFSKIYS